MDFRWDIHKKIKDLACDYMEYKNNPDLMKVFFKLNGKQLPEEKTLKELGINPEKEKIEICEMFVSPLFGDDDLL
jgi:hypothetical protein